MNRKLAQSQHIYLKKVQGKGRGVFAKKTIPVGTILEEVPLLLIAVSEAKKMEQLALNHYVFEWKKGLAIALGYGSLYNHSYAPNTIYLRNYQKQTLTFKTIRLIKKNEEITINYNGDPKSKDPVWFKVK